MSLIHVPYASAEKVVLEAVRAFMPPKDQTVAEHALEHRVLHNPGGGYSGPFDFDLVPYMREIMEKLTDHEVQTIGVAGPGQSAKTTAAENMFLYSVDSDPADILWYMQTDESVEAYVKGTINPMVDLHPELKNRIGLRPIDDSLHFKRFRGMKVEFLSATKRSLISKKAPRIVADEIDAYDQSFGDVKVQLDVRRQTFGRRSKLLMLSHPDRARGINPDTDWTSGIMAIYADSTRCLWYWPCPHCGAWSSPAPVGVRVMTIDYPTDASLAEIERAARLLCPVNGCLIEDRARRAMNIKGRWIGVGEEISEDGTVSGERILHSVAGYWIVGAMSLLMKGGIGALARDRVKAEREREVSGEDASLREVMVKRWGVPYAPPRGISSVDAAVLVQRCEPTLPLGKVVDGVRFITCSVDVQIAHFEYLVRGWGINGESWVIEHGKILAEPSTSSSDWDALLTAQFMRRFPLADGSGRVMQIRGCGYDSGGAPGVSQQAYSAWQRWRKKRLPQPDGSIASPVRYLGKISGKDVYSIVPLKGASGVNAPKLSVTYPDTSRKASVMAGRGMVPVAMFNPNQFKDDLGGQLMRAEPGNWYVHFPAGLKSREPPHTFFEQITAEAPDARGQWKKIQETARNEALDLMTMSHVVAHLHGLGRINWDRPPAWAAPWDDNPMVITPVTESPPPAPTTAGPSVTQSGEPARRSIISKLAK